MLPQHTLVSVHFSLQGEVRQDSLLRTIFKQGMQPQYTASRKGLIQDWIPNSYQPVSVPAFVTAATGILGNMGIVTNTFLSIESTQCLVRWLKKKKEKYFVFGLFLCLSWIQDLKIKHWNMLISRNLEIFNLQEIPEVLKLTEPQHPPFISEI